MDLNLDFAKPVADLMVKPIIASIIEMWIKPKIGTLFKAKEIESQMIEPFCNKFEEYLNRSYEKYSYMNTIVFQNQQKKIDELYIPLCLNINERDGDEVYKIDNYPEQMISHYKKVLITDTAGMGKSTLMKFLFLSGISNQKTAPIFIELRKLSSKNKIIDEIIRELNPVDDEFDRDFILKLIRRGDFIFFLDGYDEISLSERTRVTEDIQDFISKSGNNFFVLTSRPETALASFADFQAFSIQPLETYEAYKLIRKYDNFGTTSEELINKLEQDKKFENISEFLTNPMMVSLLYKSYTYKAVIPNKKEIFYKQVYDSLFDRHDLTKGGAFIHEKHSGLDIVEFHKVLRILGFLSLTVDKIEFTIDEITQLITEAKNELPDLKFREINFINDLITTVPLFYNEGDFYRWAHKSIQEYFAAQYICIDSKLRQKEILNSIYFSKNFDKYLNILDMCYSMDYKTFRNVIIKNILEDYLKYRNAIIQRYREIILDDTELISLVNSTFYRKAVFSDHFSFPNDSLNDFIDLANKKYNHEFNDYKLNHIYPNINEKNVSKIEFRANRFSLLFFLIAKNELFISENEVDFDETIDVDLDATTDIIFSPLSYPLEYTMIKILTLLMQITNPDEEFIFDFEKCVSLLENIKMDLKNEEIGISFKF